MLISRTCVAPSATSQPARMSLAAGESYLVDVVGLVEGQQLPQRPRLYIDGALRQAVHIAQRVALHGHVLQHAPRLHRRHRRRLS